MAASCAVPLAWPAVTIGNRRYMDGGIGSAINLDVAADCDVAVVLVPAGVSAPSHLGGGPAAEIAAFRGVALGAFADDGSLAAFGSNPLDPRCRIASALAGRAQGRSEAAAQDNRAVDRSHSHCRQQPTDQHAAFDTVGDTPTQYATPEFPIVLSAGERRPFTANDILRDLCLQRSGPDHWNEQPGIAIRAPMQGAFAPWSTFIRTGELAGEWIARPQPPTRHDKPKLLAGPEQCRGRPKRDVDLHNLTRLQRTARIQSGHWLEGPRAGFVE